MLRSLYIQNYALIEKLDISFGAGFSVITGETGAGKSIILGAIGLLLGQRAEVKAIRQGASKCVIEARFDISAYGMEPFFEENELEYEEECILRREVYASGKSRAFINDTPASLVQMKELGEQLIYNDLSTWILILRMFLLLNDTQHQCNQTHTSDKHQESNK